MEVIGDFEEKHAVGYFQKLLSAHKSGDVTRFGPDTPAWADVYGVCGGNALSLQRMSNYIAGGSEVESGKGVFLCSKCQRIFDR